MLKTLDFSKVFSLWLVRDSNFWLFRFIGTPGVRIHCIDGHFTTLNITIRGILTPLRTFTAAHETAQRPNLLNLGLTALAEGICLD
jgi:hypothetical protein